MLLPFLGCWFGYYASRTITVQLHQTSALIILIFCLLFYYFCHKLDGFRTSLFRIGEIITGQILSVGITDLAVYVIIWMQSPCIPNLLPGIGALLAQGVLISGWAVLNHRLYFKAMIIPAIIYIIFEAIVISIYGAKGTNHFSVLFLIICLILVPLQCIAEEYIFRGLIMQSLGSWFKIPILVLIVQAIIFAVTHGYNSLGVFGVFVSGLVLGFFAWKTKGLEVSAALHTVNNLVAAITVMFGLDMTSTNIALNDVILTIVLQIVLFAAIYYAGQKTYWFGEINN